MGESELKISYELRDRIRSATSPISLLSSRMLEESIKRAHERYRARSVPFSRLDNLDSIKFVSRAEAERDAAVSLLRDVADANLMHPEELGELQARVRAFLVEHDDE